MPAVIRADLERSGVFRPVAAPAGLDENSRPDLAPWKERADALLTGVSRLADGRHDVRFPALGLGAAGTWRPGNPVASTDSGWRRTRSPTMSTRS